MKAQHVLFGIMIALLLGACNLPSQPTTGAPGVEITQAAQTVAAFWTQTVDTPLPVATAVQASATYTQPAPATPTATLPPTQTPTPTITPTPLPTDCTNEIDFVADVTVPDDSVVYPGEAFDKTWRLRNSGTCTWTKDYALVFDSGEAMGGPTTQPLAADVPAGQEVEITVALKAPGTPGTYTSNWKLRNAAGEVFGTGRTGEAAFYVRVKVAEASDELSLGTPTWRDSLDSAGNWFLPDTDAFRFTIEDGHLTMLARTTGGTDSWGLSYLSGMRDYYLEVTFRTGGTCSGLDRYGVLARSPDPDAGYVYGFSCDGRYRLYAWDGENYQSIQEWQSSLHIQAGPDETNRLGIWMKDETIRLYANGVRLAEYTDGTFEEGGFGLFINAANTADLTVYVEEAAYWLLDD